MQAQAKSIEAGAYANHPAQPQRSATLMLASCQYPPDLLREIPAYESLRRMRARLRDIGREPGAGPRALWMAGDTIYVDPTAGLFDPEHPLDRYDGPYRFLQSRIWKPLIQEVDHWLCLPDDHEYEENWEPSARPRVQEKLTESLLHGKSAHLRHMRPKVQEMLTEQDIIDARFWGPVSPLPGIPGFALDLRTEREHRDAANVGYARMVSPAQMKAFEKWLLACHEADQRQPGLPPSPKLVLSASTLLPRRLLVADSERQMGLQPNSVRVAGALESDAVDGFPRFMAEIFYLIVRVGIRGLVFLSGDEHLSFITRAVLSARGHEPVTVHSIHASPLYGPYPFANGSPELFDKEETFDTIVPPAGGASVRVEADTEFIDVGNTFCEIGFDRRAGGLIELRFSGERQEARRWVRID